MYEKKYLNKGCTYICGVDEAGRGPLAGPVCVASVMFGQGVTIDGANDSKKISPKKREFLYDEITQKAIEYKICMISEQKIDEINILNATLLGMKDVIEKLKIRPDVALIDGNKSPNTAIRCESIVKGDALSMTISCASILAKVTRDRLMLEYSKQYPQYFFEKHKGYGTKLHIEMIKKYGPCPIHRRSFLKNFL